MYPPEISYLHTNTASEPIVDNLAFSVAQSMPIVKNTLDVVVYSAAADFEDDDDLLDDPEDGKLSEELEAIIYGTRDSNASEDHYFTSPEDEPEYGQLDFTFVDRYFTSLFDEEEEISYLSPLASLYKPIEYDPTLYVLSPVGEGGENGGEADFVGGVVEELAEESERGEKVDETAGNLNFFPELDLEGRLIA